MVLRWYCHFSAAWLIASHTLDVLWGLWDQALFPWQPASSQAPDQKVSADSQEPSLRLHLEQHLYTGQEQNLGMGQEQKLGMGQEQNLGGMGQEQQV